MTVFTEELKRPEKLISANNSLFHRLADDHANAKRLARGLGQIPGIRIDPPEIETNMVYFSVADTGLTIDQVYDDLVKRGVRIGSGDGKRMRAVTHLDVDESGIERVIQTMRDVVAGRQLDSCDRFLLRR